MGATRWPRRQYYENQAFAWGKRGLALLCHAEVTACGLERWFIGHASEIGLVSGMSVAQLRQDTRRYAPQLQVRAMSCWHTWLSQVSAPCYGEQ